MKQEIISICRNPGEIIVGKVVSDSETHYLLEDACVLVIAPNNANQAGFGFMPVDTVCQEPIVLFSAMVEDAGKVVRISKDNILFDNKELPEIMVDGYLKVVEQAKLAVSQQKNALNAQAQKNIANAPSENKIVKLFD